MVWWNCNLDNLTRSTEGMGAIAFSEPNGTYPFEVSAAGFPASPSSGFVTVDGESVTELIHFVSPNATYNVSFLERGLASQVRWTVTFDNLTESSTGMTILYGGVLSGNYSFSVPAVPDYVATPSSGSITVYGTDARQLIGFEERPPAMYPVTFTESGLTTGTHWSVAVGNSTETSAQPTITFGLSNGTYAYRILPVAGYHASSGGTVSVHGSGLDLPVPFVLANYSINFVESGLAGGTSWTIEVGSVSHTSTSSGIRFDEPNGTYPYSVLPVPGYTTAYSGSFLVNGAAVGVDVRFALQEYRIGFEEHGLAPGTNWSVDLGGATRSSTGEIIVFSEPNGSYPSSFSAVPGYELSTPGSTVDVQGGDLTVPVTFVAITYRLTFVESGLTAGSWTVSVDGQAQTASVPLSIGFLVANGTHNYTVAHVAGFVTAEAGSVSIVGADATVNISFQPFRYAVTFEETGLPAATIWSVQIAGQSASSASSTVTFEEPNGSYSFTTATSSSSWQTTQEFGSTDVRGAPVSLTIAFDFAYPATFVALGLPSGVEWFVNLSGTLTPTGPASAAPSPGTPIAYSFSSATPTLLFSLPNGSYAYTIGSTSPSWAPSASPQSLTVDGASPPPQSVGTVTSPGPGPGPTFGLLWVAVIAVVIVLAAVAATGYRAYSLRPPPIGGPDAIDELYLSYDLATESDPALADEKPDPLDDIF